MNDPESVFRGPRPLPGCRSTLTTLPPGGCLQFHRADWVGAVLVVVSGQLRVECWSGEGASFAAGAVLVLGGLDLKQLANTGLDPLELKTIRRVPPPQTGAGPRPRPRPRRDP